MTSSAASPHPQFQHFFIPPWRWTFTFWYECKSRPGHLQVSLSKLLTYCVLGPTQPPTLSGMEMSCSSWAMGWMPSALIGTVVCLCAAPQVQLFAIAGNGWPHNVPRYHQLTPISWHFWDCKVLPVLSLLMWAALQQVPRPLPLPLPSKSKVFISHTVH